MGKQVWNGVEGMEAKWTPNLLGLSFLLNSGLKQATTGFLVVLQDVLVLLQDALFYYRKQVESLEDGRKGRIKCGKGVWWGNKAWRRCTLSKAQSNASRWLDSLIGNDNLAYKTRIQI